MHRDAHLDPDRRLDRPAAARRSRRAAARADRGVVPGEHDLPVHRGVLHLDATSRSTSGSVLLMALGTQWYILFNVIAGAMAIPTDLREAAALFGLHRWQLWKTLIIPAIFPFWVTGAVTAAGGAWNASIVAEVASVGQRQARRRRPGCVHCAGDREGRPAGDLLQHHRDGALRRRHQSHRLAPPV